MNATATEPLNQGATAVERHEVRHTLFRVVRVTLLIFAVLVVGAFLLEGAMRLYVAKVTPTVFAFDPEIGWTHRANTSRFPTGDGRSYRIEIDALGLRGRSHDFSADRKRVLVLGDSFIEGFQVSNEETMTSVWERLRPDLTVLNSGVSGYSTLQETMLARRLEPVVHPDLEVIVVCGCCNDLTDNIMPYEFSIGPRPYVDSELQIHPPDWAAFAPLLLPIPGATWLHRHSVVAYAVYRRLFPLLHGDGSQLHQQWRQRVPDVDSWRVMESVLANFAPGRHLVIVAAPSFDDVSSGNRTFATKLGEIAARIGVPFVDLQPDLHVDDYLSDHHWNAAGHATAAHRLASAVLPSPEVAVPVR